MFEKFFTFYKSENDTWLNNRLDVIYYQLNAIDMQIKKGDRKMSVAIENLSKEVQEIGAVVDSAIELISGLATQISDLKNDPVALEALATELDTKAAALAAAVAANTVAEDEVDPEV